MKLKLTDVRLMVAKGNIRGYYGHFWDQKKFSKNGYPVALCKALLVPRRIEYFLTSEEMKQVPFCQKCLSMIER